MSETDDDIDRCFICGEPMTKGYGTDAYLNFPRAGEKLAVPSVVAEGLCTRGHNLNETGYVRPDGRGITCRACNREAVERCRRSTQPQQIVERTEG